MDRIWGGRKLESDFRKKLPPKKRIGESWEIVDRPEAQSVVAGGPLKGTTLHELWTNHREEVFGESPQRRAGSAPPDRFPLLIKLLDAEEKLSLQVHPPAEVAKRLGSEPKTEFWYVARAEPGAELYVGLRERISEKQFRRALDAGTAADHLQVIPVKAGDGMFLPSGRFHAIGGGNLLVEVQQNSDTTYRVFDWNRPGLDGKPRELHIAESMQSIDFDDIEPSIAKSSGDALVECDYFNVEKWNLDGPRDAFDDGTGNRSQRQREAVVRILDRRRVRGRLRHTIKGLDRSAACAVHKCEVRPAGCRVRRHDLRRGALFQGD